VQALLLIKQNLLNVWRKQVCRRRVTVILFTHT
jgi:hypothetical protein